MSGFARAAQIVTTRGNQGSVVCKAAGALPFLLREGQTAHFVPPTLRGPLTAVVEQMRAANEGAWEVVFSDVRSLGDAEALMGSYCLVPDDQLPALSAADEPVLLVGYSLHDAAFGDLGSVEEVQQSPAQALLVVQGARGQVLVPFVDEFVVEVDEQERVVRTRIPEGLIALNEQGEQE